MHDIQHLSISAISSVDNRILTELARLASHHECRISNCHINLHGTHYIMNALLSGSWSAIAKIETGLKILQQESGLQLTMARTSLSVDNISALPYVLYIIAQDDSQILHQVLQFLQQDTVIVQEIFSESYKARYTQAPMQSITIRIQLSASVAVGEWRERYMLFSDDLNLDAVMEPEKW